MQTVILVSCPLVAAPDAATETISDGFGATEPAGFAEAAADPAGLADAMVDPAGFALAALDAAGAFDAGVGELATGAAADPHPARRINIRGASHFMAGIIAHRFDNRAA